MGLITLFQNSVIQTEAVLSQGDKYCTDYELNWVGFEVRLFQQPWKRGHFGNRSLDLWGLRSGAIPLSY